MRLVESWQRETINAHVLHCLEEGAAKHMPEAEERFKGAAAFALVLMLDGLNGYDSERVNKLIDEAIARGKSKRP